MKILYALLVFVPIAIIARLAGASPIAVFILSALAIIPLSGVLGAATGAVAEHTSPAIGGVLSATMGNLAELSDVLQAETAARTRARALIYGSTPSGDLAR